MSVGTVAGRVGTLAQLPTGARPIGSRYHAYDTHQDFEWNGAAWIEVPPVSYDKMVLGAGMFVADAGATPVVNSNYPLWSFATGVTQGISAPFTFPPGWSKFYVGAAWVNLGAGTGAVRWQVQIKNFSIGIDLTTEAPYVDVTTTPAAVGQNVVNASFLTPNLAPLDVSPGPFGSEFLMHINRVGGGPDTLANAAGIGIISLNRMDA